MFRVKILLHTYIYFVSQSLRKKKDPLTFGEEHTTIPTFGSYFFDVVPQKFWNQISDIVRLL